MGNIKVICNRDDIVSVADAVRSKTGISDEMTLSEIVTNINNIAVGSNVNMTFNKFSVTDDGNGNITINNEGA